MNFSSPILKGVLFGVLMGSTSIVQPVLRPLQVVGTRGEMNNLAYSTGLTQMGRTRAYIGGDCTTLALADGHWYCTATGEVNAPNPVTFARALECNGVTVQLTYGGATSITLNPGDTVITDEVPASAFGLEKFTQDTIIWCRFERSRETGQSHLVHGSSAYPTAITGEALIYRSDTLGASKLLEVGALNTTGGWTSSFGAAQYFPLAVLGRSVKPLMALMITGASKEVGQSDSTGDGNNDGGGYVRRALANIGGHRLPYIHAAASGESAQNFLASSSKRRALLPYVTHVFCGHGGNDYSLGQTLANTKTRISAEWALLKSHGAKVLQTLEMPKTNGTFTTVAGQTPKAGYETGGAWRDPFNAHITAALGTEIDGIITGINEVAADATQPDRWIANGSGDGVHPAKTTQIAMVTPLASYLAPLRAAFEA